MLLEKILKYDCLTGKIEEAKNILIAAIKVQLTEKFIDWVKTYGLKDRIAAFSIDLPYCDQE